MAKITGKLLQTEISEDGTTWLSLICESTSGSGLTRDTATAPLTKCDDSENGQEVTLNGYSWKFDFDALTDDNPSGTQATYKEMAEYFLSGTKLYTRRKYDGTTGDFTISGRAYLTELSESAEREGYLTFTGTLTGTGDVTIA